jgi:PKD repeat protein
MNSPSRILSTGCSLLFILLLLQGVRATGIGGVEIFPPDHVWNVPVDNLPADSRSADYVSRIGTTNSLHPDFGSGLYEGVPMGIPYNMVNGSVSKQSVVFDYDDESDPGPYPIPANPLIEGGGGSEGDRHLLVIQKDENILYELYAAEKQPDGSWHAGSGAVFNLSGYRLRPAGWTSTDAAGLAVLPGLVRYEEVRDGAITHAIRFTAPQTQRAYVWPARHFASSITDLRYPPMGQRFRLKPSFNTSGYPYQARIILEALKKYGMILSDNGGAWYITGTPDERWDNDDLHTLRQVKGSDFEAVDETSLMINPGSGRANLSRTELPTLPGQTKPPTDPDHDGICEDLNGNGRKDFGDIILFFEQLDWIAAHEPVAAFDVNSNGRVEFSDIVPVFKEQ